MKHDDRAADLRNRLWNDAAAAEPTTPSVHTPQIGYDQALLEQYKIYVEMADRISQRRAVTNTFFLSLNTGIFTLVALVWASPPAGSEVWLLPPTAALWGECFAWYYLVRSYRQLNTAKFQVIGVLEERLPASPFWRAEWWALGEGKDPKRYWPLSHIEQWLPILFGIAYLAGLLALLFA